MLNSCDGMLPVKSLPPKKDSKQNHQSQHQTLKKNYFPNGMQFLSWLEWQHLHSSSAFRLDNIPSSDGMLPVKSLPTKNNSKQNHQSQHQTLKKNIYHTACSFHYGWSGITYIHLTNLGSTTFPARMVWYLSSHCQLKRIRNKTIKVNIKPSRKIISRTACSFHHGWSGITYIDRVLVGSTAFPARMVWYLSSHFHLINCWEEVEGHE